MRDAGPQTFVASFVVSFVETFVAIPRKLEILPTRPRLIASYIMRQLASSAGESILLPSMQL